MEFAETVGGDGDGVTEYSTISFYDWTVDLADIIEKQRMGWLTYKLLSMNAHSRTYIEEITTKGMKVHFTCGYAIELSWERMSYSYKFSFGHSDYTHTLRLVPTYEVKDKIAQYTEIHWDVSCLERLKIEREVPIPKNLYSVDLGLSVDWAGMNIGADKPEDFGVAFAWGLTVPNKEGYGYWRGLKDANGKDMYNERGNSSYKYSGLEAYDAATKIWGEGWRVPTHAEVSELFFQCTWEWTKLNGKDGYKVVGKTGEWIFLPISTNSKDYSGRSHTEYWIADGYMMPGGSTKGETMELCNFIEGDYKNQNFSDCSTEFRLIIRPVHDK